MKIVVLTGSYNMHGTSNTLVNEFIKGAEENNNEIVRFDTAHLDIHPSCENDEERGFDISGLYGKTWWGEMGFEDPYGERLYSYITFTSGAFPDHGVGTEERCYYDDELYRVYKFDWEIQNGWLYLYYSDGYTFIIEYPSVSGRYFYGTAEDGFEIRLEWVDGRSIRKKVS